MNKKIYALLLAQFLSAFADNAILFTVIALVMQSTQLATWYVPALQSVFLISFILFAPWVGLWADKHPKKYILITANLIKAAGAGLLLLNIEPLVAYALVGLGAALYSPAKYGILPELAPKHLLVKANSWIEGSTIFAILLGMMIGAKLADESINLALFTTVILFILSALMSLFLPEHNKLKNQPSASTLKQFYQHLRIFLATTESRFAILNGALFWLAAATLRVILIAWAPLILLTQSASDIAELTLFLAIGIIIGSAIVPKIIPLDAIHLVRYPAAMMGVFILILSLMDTHLEARISLFFIGCAGGMFIVPINAILQDIGQHSIGSGAAVALQNFFQNIAMLIGVGVFTYSSSIAIHPIIAMLSLGLFILISTVLINIKVPKLS